MINYVLEDSNCPSYASHCIRLLRRATYALYLKVLFSINVNSFNKLAVPTEALRVGWRPILDYYRTNSSYNTVFLINTLKTFFKNELEHILYPK